MNGLELFSGYCFKVIVLGLISGGNFLGILGRFPIWEFGALTPRFVMAKAGRAFSVMRRRSPII